MPRTKIVKKNPRTEAWERSLTGGDKSGHQLISHNIGIGGAAVVTMYRPARDTV